MANDPVVILGLREMLGALRAANAALPREVSAAGKKAAELVAERTRASFLSRGGVAPKVAASVRALGQQRAAYVRIGGNAYPYAMGSEFGSIRFKQFPAWRGSAADAGYSLYPSIRASRDDVIRIYGDLIDALLKRTFPS